MSMDSALLKKPESYGSYGTAMGRSLLPSEAHGNLEVFVEVIDHMLGGLTPATFGARYGDASKAWVPVGTEYRQLPGSKPAPELYSGTWAYYGQAGSGLSSRSGRFDRAEGGTYGGVLGNVGANQNAYHRHGASQFTAGAGLLGGSDFREVAGYTGYEGGGEARPDFETRRDWVKIAD